MLALQQSSFEFSARWVPAAIEAAFLSFSAPFIVELKVGRGNLCEHFYILPRLEISSFIISSTAELYNEKSDPPMKAWVSTKCILFLSL